MFETAFRHQRNMAALAFAFEIFELWFIEICFVFRNSGFVLPNNSERQSKSSLGRPSGSVYLSGCGSRHLWPSAAMRSSATTGPQVPAA